MSDVPNTTFPLLLLPSLPMERVVYFLDVRSLKQLRLTSKRTRGLVENNQIIKRFVISINDSQRIADVANSPTPWNNFCFNLTEELLLDHAELLSQWTDSYGTVAKIISIKKGMTKPLARMFPRSGGSIVNPLMRVLLYCTQLESVEIDEMDFTIISSLNWAILLKNWKKLKQLHILRVRFISDASNVRFGEILKNVEALKSVTLPRILASQNCMSSVPIIGAHADENFTLYKGPVIREYEKLILFPLICKIKEEVKSYGITSIQSITVPDELVTLKSYIELAKLCVQTKITLHHFFPSVIPSHMLHVLNEHSNISSCIGSVAGMNEDLLRQPLPKLETLEINRSNFLFLSNMYDEEPLLPALENFHLHMSSWPDPNRDPDSILRLSEFVYRIQSRKRPSVRTVSITGLRSIRSWSNIWPRANILPLIVSPLLSFVNLTNLKLDSVGYVPEEYLSLWEHLKRLQRVSLTNCLGCNDAAIIGKDTPEPTEDPAQLILSLNDLNYITLCKVGRITCNSYKRAFAKMKLVRLHHEPRNKRTVDDSAFTALIEGETWEHLESLQCSDIAFSNYREKQDFFRKFASPQSPERAPRLNELSGGSRRCKSKENFKNCCVCC